MNLPHILNSQIAGPFAKSRGADSSKLTTVHAQQAASSNSAHQVEDSLSLDAKARSLHDEFFQVQETFRDSLGTKADLAHADPKTAIVRDQAHSVSLGLAMKIAGPVSGALHTAFGGLTGPEVTGVAKFDQGSKTGPTSFNAKVGRSDYQKTTEKDGTAVLTKSSPKNWGRQTLTETLRISPDQQLEYQTSTTGSIYIMDRIGG